MVETGRRRRWSGQVAFLLKHFITQTSCRWARNTHANPSSQLSSLIIAIVMKVYIRIREPRGGRLDRGDSAGLLEKPRRCCSFIWRSDASSGICKARGVRLRHQAQSRLWDAEVQTSYWALWVHATKAMESLNRPSFCSSLTAWRLQSLERTRPCISPCLSCSAASLHKASPILGGSIAGFEDNAGGQGQTSMIWSRCGEDCGGAGGAGGAIWIQPPRGS